MRRSSMTTAGLALLACLVMAPAAFAAGCASHACGPADAVRHGKTTTAVTAAKPVVRTETRINTVKRVRLVTKVNNVTRTRYVDVVRRRIDTTYIQPIKRVTIIRQIQPVLQKRTVTRYETVRIVRHTSSKQASAPRGALRAGCGIKPTAETARCARLK